MSQRSILVTARDRDRLREVLRQARRSLGVARPYLETLNTDLDKATVVPPDGCHGDVVTMNSAVCVRDSQGGRLMVLTLVYPDRATLDVNQLSVLAPLGAALLGCRVGDVVSFDVPDGVRSCKIERISHPIGSAEDLLL
jgi:regulator of nucleoside diphosphate kinase